MLMHVKKRRREKSQSGRVNERTNREKLSENNVNIDNQSDSGKSPDICQLFDSFFLRNFLRWICSKL